MKREPARINTNLVNGVKLRKAQADYQRKFNPLKISLEAVADIAIEHGLDGARRKLNLSK